MRSTLFKPSVLKLLGVVGIITLTLSTYLGKAQREEIEDKKNQNESAIASKMADSQPTKRKGTPFVKVRTEKVSIQPAIGDSTTELVSELYELISAENSTEEIEKKLAKLSKISPGAAFSFLIDIPIMSQSGNYFSLVLEVYMSEDLEGAGSAVANLPYSRIKPNLVDQYVYQVSKSSPEEALNWTEGIGRIDLKNSARQSIIETWADNAPHEALVYLSSIPSFDSERLGQVIADAAYTLAKADPANALGLIYQYNRRARPSTAAGVARALHEIAPRRAKAWLNTINEKSIRRAATQSLDAYSQNQTRGSTLVKLHQPSG